MTNNIVLKMREKVTLFLAGGLKLLMVIVELMKQSNGTNANISGEMATRSDKLKKENDNK